MSSPISRDGSVVSTRRPAQNESSLRSHSSGDRPRAQSSDLSPREEAPTPTSVTGRPSGMPPSGSSMTKPSAAPRLSTGSHGRSRSFAGTTANTASNASPRPPRSLQASTADHNRITVACRVRPRSDPSRGAGCVSVDEDARTVSWSEGNADTASARHFTFDYAAGPRVGQEELFEQVGRPVTNACLDGYNGTIFCYGQTGSGKTFTTFGPPTKPRVEASSSGYIGLDAPLGVDRGLVPRVLEYLFERFSKAGQGSPEKSGADSGPAEMHSCRCSFYEIYNEHVFDLAAGDVAGSSSKERASLNVREAAEKGAFVEGLREEQVKSAGEAVEVLRRGYASRHTASTAMNAASSRSHAIFTMVIDTVLPASVAPECERDSPSAVGTSDPPVPRDRYSSAHALLVDPQLETGATTPRSSPTPSGAIRKRTARFNLVDLAGSERQSKAHTRGAQLKDAASINKSLSALGRVINSLVEGAGAGHVPYRDSKLTRLLAHSIGGNSKTILVAAVSAEGSNAGETLSTLKFVQRAKMIKNMAIRNEETHGGVMDMALKQENEGLRRLVTEKDMWLSEAKCRLEEADSQREMLTRELITLRQEARMSQDSALDAFEQLSEREKAVEYLQQSLVSKERELATYLSSSSPRRGPRWSTSGMPSKRVFIGPRGNQDSSRHRRRGNRRRSAGDAFPPSPASPLAMRSHPVTVRLRKGLFGRRRSSGNSHASEADVRSTREGSVSVGSGPKKAVGSASEDVARSHPLNDGCTTCSSLADEDSTLTGDSASGDYHFRLCRQGDEAPRESNGERRTSTGSRAASRHPAGMSPVRGVRETASGGNGTTDKFWSPHETAVSTAPPPESALTGNSGNGWAGTGLEQPYTTPPRAGDAVPESLPPGATSADGSAVPASDGQQDSGYCLEDESAGQAPGIASSSKPIGATAVQKLLKADAPLGTAAAVERRGRFSHDADEEACRRDDLMAAAEAARTAVAAAEEAKAAAKAAAAASVNARGATGIPLPQRGISMKSGRFARESDEGSGSRSRNRTEKLDSRRTMTDTAEASERSESEGSETTTAPLLPSEVRSPVRRSPVRRSPARRTPARRSPVRRSPARRRQSFESTSVRTSKPTATSVTPERGRRAVTSSVNVGYTDVLVHGGRAASRAGVVGDGLHVSVRAVIDEAPEEGARVAPSPSVDAGFGDQSLPVVPHEAAGIFPADEVDASHPNFHHGNRTVEDGQVEEDEVELRVAGSLGEKTRALKIDTKPRDWRSCYGGDDMLEVQKILSGGSSSPSSTTSGMIDHVSCAGRGAGLGRAYGRGRAGALMRRGREALEVEGAHHADVDSSRVDGKPDFPAMRLPRTSRYGDEASPQSRFYSINGRDESRPWVGIARRYGKDVAGPDQEAMAPAVEAEQEYAASNPQESNRVDGSGRRSPASNRFDEVAGKALTSEDIATALAEATAAVIPEDYHHSSYSKRLRRSTLPPPKRLASRTQRDSSPMRRVSTGAVMTRPMRRSLGPGTCRTSSSASASTTSAGAGGRPPSPSSLRPPPRPVRRTPAPVQALSTLDSLRRGASPHEPWQVLGSPVSSLADGGAGTDYSCVQHSYPFNPDTLERSASSSTLGSECDQTPPSRSRESFRGSARGGGHAGSSRVEAGMVARGFNLSRDPSGDSLRGSSRGRARDYGLSRDPLGDMTPDTSRSGKARQGFAEHRRVYSSGGAPPGLGRGVGGELRLSTEGSWPGELGTESEVGSYMGSSEQSAVALLAGVVDMLREQSDARDALAEPCLRRSLEIHEQLHGPNHPEVAKDLSDLAEVLQDKGEIENAEPLHRRALEIRERWLGPDHNDVAFSLNNLALVYRAKGQQSKAARYKARANQIWEKVYSRGVVYPRVERILPLTAGPGQEGSSHKASPPARRGWSEREFSVAFNSE